MYTDSCLIDPKIIKKIQKRNNKGYKVNKDLINIFIGLLIGIILMMLLNNKDTFISKVKNINFSKLKKPYKKSYKVEDDIYEEEIDYRGPTHNIYTT